MLVRFFNTHPYRLLGGASHLPAWPVLALPPCLPRLGPPQVEIRPGVFHVVEEPPGGRAGARGAPEAARGAAGAGAGAAAAGGGRPRRPISAPPRMRPGAGGGAGGGVVDRRTVEVLPEVAVLEGRMREALRRSAAVGVVWCGHGGGGNGGAAAVGRFKVTLPDRATPALSL